MVQVVARTARLLGREGDEPHRMLTLRVHTGQLEHHGHAGCVVLCAGRLRHGVEVGTDDAVVGLAVEPLR